MIMGTVLATLTAVVVVGVIAYVMWLRWQEERFFHADLQEQKPLLKLSRAHR